MYLAFFVTAFQAKLAYRGQVWASIFGDLVGLFAMISIWIALYAGAGSASNVTLKEMITYAMFSSLLLHAWSWTEFVQLVGRQIKTGDVAVFLLKPLRYPMMLLAGEGGKAAFRLLTVVLPVSLIVSLIYGVSPPASGFHALMTLLFLILGFAILFLLATIAGLLGFWVMTVFSLEWTLQALLLILAGWTVPLWFFPAPAAAIIERLPFAYTAYHPMAVYLGKFDIEKTLWVFAIGVGWAVLLGLFAAWLWSRARQRIVVQGG
jgi:ABC-2 type transport system permease protein